MLIVPTLKMSMQDRNFYVQTHKVNNSSVIVWLEIHLEEKGKRLVVEEEGILEYINTI
jgi:hypothetical protein